MIIKAKINNEILEIEREYDFNTQKAIYKRNGEIIQEEIEELTNPLKDIGSENEDVFGKLSNFTSFAFEIDNVKCMSMEGFLQSLKFEDIETQEQICALKGFDAKRKGSARNLYWKAKKGLWWRGIFFPRDSQEYQELLNRAYAELFKNEDFKRCLKETGDAIFTHKIGKRDIFETVLTEEEFCVRLQNLKNF